MSDALPAAPGPDATGEVVDTIIFGIKFKAQFFALGAAIVFVAWYLCRQPAKSRDGDYEVDETGRRRKIMHGDL